MFYSQLTSKVIHARSVQAVVYLKRHVVSFEYFNVIVEYNNRLYIRDVVYKVEWARRVGSPDLWGGGKWGVRDKSNRSILLGYPYKKCIDVPVCRKSVVKQVCKIHKI